MSAYTTAVLALSPTAYYRCNEPSGGTLHDTSGNTGNDLTTFGSATLGSPGLVPTDGTSGSCAFVNLGGSFCSAAQVGTDQLATDTWGIVAWIQTSTASQTSTISQWNGLSIGMVSGLLQMKQVGVPGSGGQLATGTTVPADGLPHMVALVYTNSALSFLVDGVVLGTAVWSKAATSVPNNSSVGYAPNFGGDGTTGHIGDVAFIPNLTVAQVQNLFAIGSGAIIGSGTAVQGAQTVSSSGSVTAPPVTSTGSSVQSAQTVSASGKETISGTATSVQAAQNVAATGTSFTNATGTAATAQSAQTVAATGSESFPSTGTSVQGAQTVAATGKETFSSTGTAVQGAQTVAASGTSISPPVSSTGAPIQSAQNVAATGAAGSPPVSSTGTSVQGAQSVAASGSVTEPHVTSIGATVQSAQSVSASGVVDALGTAAIVQAPQTVAASGHVQNLVPPEIVLVHVVIETANDIVLPILLRNT